MKLAKYEKSKLLVWLSFNTFEFLLIARMQCNGFSIFNAMVFGFILLSMYWLGKVIASIPENESALRKS